MKNVTYNLIQFTAYRLIMFSSKLIPVKNWIWKGMNLEKLIILQWMLIQGKTTKKTSEPVFSDIWWKTETSFKNQF